jgi:hypothetical protein
LKKLALLTLEVLRKQQLAEIEVVLEQHSEPPQEPVSL